MGQPYTERFVHSVESVWSDYVVPQGYRAVATFVVWSNSADATPTALAIVGPAIVFARSLPVALQSGSVEMRAVAYGGELIRALAAHVDAHVSVTGYLFSEAGRSSRRDPAPPPSHEAMEAVMGCELPR